MVLPSEQAIRLVIRQTASLRHHLGAEIGRRPLVLPNGQFFPDVFTGDTKSVSRLVQRIQEHAGMLDVPIQTKVLGLPDSHEHEHQCKGDCGGKGCAGCDGSCHDRKQDHEQARKKEMASASQGCGTGCGTSCGVPEEAASTEPRLVDLGEGWRVQVPLSELRQPMILTTNLARALGVVFLVETRSAGQPAYENLEATADLAAVLLGFGALLLSGSHIYSKSCGGPKVHRITALSCGELAIATVLNAKCHNQDLRPLLRELDVTQKEAVTAAEAFFSERPTIVQRFSAEPERLVHGEIPMAPTAAKGLWSRLFGKSPNSRDLATDPEASLADLEAMLAKAPKRVSNGKRRDARADELRALVDEALGDPGSQIQ